MNNLHYAVSNRKARKDWIYFYLKKKPKGDRLSVYHSYISIRHSNGKFLLKSKKITVTIMKYLISLKIVFGMASEIDQFINMFTLSSSAFLITDNTVASL